MLYQDIRAAFETTLYNLDTTFPTAWENTEFTPDENTAYQRVQLVMRVPTDPTTSSDYRRENGEFQVFVSYPSNTGVNAAYTKAAAISGIFKRGTTLVQGDTKVQILESPHVGTAMQFADRYVVPVSISFICNIFN